LLAEQENKRLRKKLKKKEVKEHPFKFFICVDFEATCFDNPVFNRRRIQELIQFPACLINLDTGKIEKEFNEFVRPTEFPELSNYCKNLTNIQQSDVDGADPLPIVLNRFDIWLKETIKEYNLILPKTKKSNLEGNTALMTWTNWDFLIQLRHECNRKQLRRASYFNQYIDLKEIFSEKNKFKDQFSFGEAIVSQGLEFIGQQHNGLHDARNTAYLAYHLHKKGTFFHITKDMNHFSKLNRPF
jgi:ERI1 exoribonuclease 2